MASYHLSAKILSRSSGRSAVAAASYRARTQIKDVRQGMTFDYSQKNDLGHSEILAPENSPEWVYDRAELWNRVEANEKRKDAQLMREIEVALPKELNTEEQAELLREFCNDNFVNKGMIADINVHQDGNNPHAHIMLTMRKVKGEGFGKKERSWNNKNNLIKWREEWANVQNIHLAKAGHDIRVDHRNYVQQGIDIEPQTKRGITFHSDTSDFERAEEYKRIAFENGQRIIEKPEIALDHITKYQSTFTHDDLLKYIHSHTDESQFQDALNAVTNSSEIVMVEENEYDRFNKYTTKSLLNIENTMLADASGMASSSNHSVEAKYINQAAVNCNLSQEQRGVLTQTIEGGDIHAIVGHAGTGKSYTLNAMREAYEAQGYKLQGVSLSGVAAEGLENSSGIKSTTIHRKFYDWDNGRDQLDSKSVLVVDEAGMVGTRQTQRIISEAQKVGAKVIFVGDTKQTQAIEAGGAFRGIIERVGTSRLTEVWRQNDDWQKEATKLLSGNRADINKAIDTFKAHGNIHSHAEYKQAASTMLMQYVNDYQADKTSVMIAHTNDEVSRLNIVCRHNLKKRSGFIGEDEIKIKTTTGVKSFAAGDRVLFLRNERSIGVKNGTFGTVSEVDKYGRLFVSLDNKRDVVIDTDQYNSITYGYAATVHKLQGATIDKSFVLASEGFDRHLGYVAMSRHRETMNLYYSRDKYQNYEDLKRKLSNLGDKELLADYRVEHNDVDQILRQLTDKNATFGDKEYEDALAGVRVYEGAQGYYKDNIGAVGYDAKGRLKYSTADMIGAESNLFASSQNLSHNKAHAVNRDDVYKIIGHKGLDKNQQFVIGRVAGGGGLSIVKYEYGTDRKAVAASLGNIYRDRGYVVEAVSLSGMGANNFEKETGVESKTISKALWEWKNGRNRLNEKSVLMIDNANLVGTRQTLKIVEEAEKAGAKVIMFGDSQELQSIDAGGAFRGILNNTNADRVTLARSDKKAFTWEQECQDLLRGDEKDAAKAIDLYAHHGYIERSSDPVKSVVTDWVNQVRRTGYRKNAMLAYTNNDVQDLNLSARAELQVLGYVDNTNEIEVQTYGRGTLNISGGDRIVFLKKDDAMGINSGTLGSVRGIDGNRLTVRLDGGPVVTVDTKIYNDIDYGYATTVYRGASMGADNTYVLPSTHFNKHITSAALSAHSKSAKMYHDFESYKSLRRTLSRSADKDLAADYPMDSKAYRITVKLRDNSVPVDKYVVVEPQINKDAEKKELNRKAWGFAKQRANKAGLKADDMKNITIKLEQIPMEKYQDKMNEVARRRSRDKGIGR